MEESQSVLGELIWDRRLDEVAERLRTEEGREDLTRKDGWGRYPLNLVCHIGTHIHLVEAMVAEFPAAAADADNFNNSLPLHYACLHGDVYLRAFKLILDVYPEGAKAIDDDGFLPLHNAAKYGDSPSLAIFRTLIDVHPEGASTPTIDGELPIHCLAGSYGGIPTHRLAEDASPDENEDEEVMREGVKVLFQPILGNEEALLSSVMGETPLHIASRFDVLSLQTCVSIERCPAEVVMAVARRHPEQLRERDGDGNNPLHLLVSNSYLNGARVLCPASTGGGESSDDGDEGGIEAGDGDGDEVGSVNDARVEKDLIGELVKLCREAASERNADGRFPLCLAIQSGKRWEEGVEAIAATAGHVVVERDEATGLYPFMLAATGDDPCLDTVFVLLRLCPELQRFAFD